jgi:hypothetical protein
VIKDLRSSWMPDFCTLVSGPLLTSTVVLKGSAEEILKELRRQKKTGTVEIGLSQGGTGFVKFTEKVSISE